MAVFVDAGYLLAAGGWVTVGSWKRADSRIRSAEAITWLGAQAELECPNHELLRTYWYDAAPRREPEPQHRDVARQRDTKLRLGSINAYGQQKGVDALLVADMMDLATARVIDAAILVSGDEDLLVAVKRVQAQGIRMILWGIDTPQNTVSVELRYEADRVRMLTGEELRPFFVPMKAAGEASDSPERSDAPTSVGIRTGAQADSAPTRSGWTPIPLLRPASDDGGAVLLGNRPSTYADVDPSEVAKEAEGFVRSLIEEGEDLAAISVDRPQIPAEVDSRLLRWVCARLNVPPVDQLDFDVRVAMRRAFWSEIDRRHT